MDGNAGDEPDVDAPELWRRLKAAQRAYEDADKENKALQAYRSKAHTFNKLVAQVANLKRENASLQKRLDAANGKVAAQRQLVQMAKDMVAALKTNARQD